MTEEYQKIFTGEFGSYGRFPKGENDKILAALGYPIPLVAIIALFAVKPLSPFLRFHAIQALSLGVVIWGLMMIAGALSAVLIGLCLMPLVFILWVYAWVIAVILFTDKDHRVPMIADWVEKTFV